MLDLKIEEHCVRIGPRFSVSFQRTLRIPEDGQTYPLPPTLGRFPIHPFDEFAGRLPAAWRSSDAILIPMFQREALWLGFEAADWKPNAIKVGAGNADAISGEPWEETLHADPQDYLVCPEQPWLDGINAGEGAIRQFVAVPLGMGDTVEGQLTGEEQAIGIRILAFEPRPGRFPDQAPPSPEPDLEIGPMMGGPEPVMAGATSMAAPESEGIAQSMGLGAGGQIEQKVYPDPYGIDTWDPGNSGGLSVYIVNSKDYRALTGLPAPPTPISARTYTEHGFPWFEIYDEEKGDLKASDALKRVQSVGRRQAARGIAPDGEEEAVEIPESSLRRVRLDVGDPRRESSEPER